MHLRFATSYAGGTCVEEGTVQVVTPSALPTNGPVTLDGGTTPEPSSFLLLGSGLAGLAGMLKRKLAA